MRLAPVERRELVKRLRAFGWEGPFPGAKHSHMARGKVQLTIPNPHGGVIGVKLLKLVLDAAGISRPEWLRQR